jgi:hypothetical protein
LCWTGFKLRTISCNLSFDLLNDETEGTDESQDGTLAKEHKVLVGGIFGRGWAPGLKIRIIDNTPFDS